jgi:hypothetical protein
MPLLVFKSPCIWFYMLEMETIYTISSSLIYAYYYSDLILLLYVIISFHISS